MAFYAVADPMYHNSGDLSEREGYDFDQLKAIAKVQVSMVFVCSQYILNHVSSSPLFFTLLGLNSANECASESAKFNLVFNSETF